MARDIPSIEPEGFLAGETVKWTKSLDDFSASEGAVLKYSLRGANQLDVTAETYGTDDFLTTITSTQSAGLNTGSTDLSVWWQSYVELDGERYKIDEGVFTVEPDLANEDTTYDGRSHAKTMLDALESLAEGKASLDQKQLMIGERQITRLSPKELIEWTQFYRARYQSEQRQLRISKGLGTNRTILTKFV